MLDCDTMACLRFKWAKSLMVPSKSLSFMVPRAGLEPARRVRARDFKSRVSTKFHHRGQNGGEGGIRTPGRDQPSTVFKTAALNRSATSP